MRNKHEHARKMCVITPFPLSPPHHDAVTQITHACITLNVLDYVELMARMYRTYTRTYYYVFTTQVRNFQIFETGEVAVTHCSAMRILASYREPAAFIPTATDALHRRRRQLLTLRSSL